MPRAWTLVTRPQGTPRHSDFALVDLPSAPLEEGQVRVANRWLSVDPYMRGRMNDVKSYVPPFKLDAPMEGGAVGEVVESRAEGIAPGQLVLHMLGWRDEAGAVGSTVVQVAKAKGMTVIGSAGGAEKVEWVRSLGADAVIDYKAGSIVKALGEAAPEGIDVYFDNVGGDHLDAALAHARPRARFAICGMIDVYNDAKPTQLKYLARLIGNRVTMRGFIVSDHMGRAAEFHQDMGAMLADGKLRSEETVHDGLEAMPDAFLGLFSGGNRGKMLVRL